MIKDKQNVDVLISILTYTCEQVFVLDAEANTGLLIQDDKQIEIVDFNQWWKDCYERSYEGDDVAVFASKMTGETILQVLDGSAEYVVEYSVRAQDRKKRMQAKAFWIQEKKNVCVCVKDITEHYEETQKNRRIVSESLDVAQNSSVERYRIWKEMGEEVKIPVEQACEMIEMSKEKDGSLKAEYVDRLKRLLDRHKYNLEQWFLLALMEKGENLACDQVIFPDVFLDDLECMLDARNADTGVTYEMSNKCPQVFSFMSDGVWLKQMLCEAMEIAAAYSENKVVKSSLEFAMDEPTEEQEEVFDFRFKICIDTAVAACDLEQRMLNVKYLAEYLKGNMYITVREEQMEIVFRIPVKRPSLEEEKIAGTVAHMFDNTQGNGFAGFRALVADDDEINRGIVSLKLKMLGLMVEQAVDGEEVIEKLAASPEGYYNVVFMKMILPKKTGLDATMEIREMERHDLNDITIIAYTSNPMRDRRIRALEHGMDYHLILPFEDLQLKGILIRELEGVGPKEQYTKFGFRVLK
nr:response regulator [Lachnospiraceae bacterium]